MWNWLLRFLSSLDHVCFVVAYLNNYKASYLLFITVECFGKYYDNVDDQILGTILTEVSTYTKKGSMISKSSIICIEYFRCIYIYILVFLFYNKWQEHIFKKICCNMTMKVVYVHKLIRWITAILMQWYFTVNIAVNLK